MWKQRVARQHVESVFGVLTNKYALSKLHQSKDEEDVKVEVGSSEYIKGMVTSSVEEDAASDRVKGDKLLGPTLKLAGGTALALVALLLAFMASNGLF